MSLSVKLIEGSDNNFRDPIPTIFANRHVQNAQNVLNPSKSVFHSPYLLKNIEAAAEIFVKHADLAHEISILCDCDPDGFTSAALVYLYLKDLNFGGKINVLFHVAKQHGLASDIKVPESTSLLVIPDAGSNDVMQCQELSKAMDIIILDHHICDAPNPYATVVNNQMCDYPNKDLSGVGIVYKFLQVVDDILWNSYADKYLDLVALGNIADVMDIRSPETYSFCRIGLANIQNPLMKAFMEANSFTIQSAIPTIIDVQFNFVPAMNAIIRVGTQKQKEQMFYAMVGKQESFEYTPTRGKNKGVTTTETLAQHVVRESASARYKQKKTKTVAIDAIQQMIEKYHWDDNKVLFCNVSGILDQSLTGVTAINLAEMYNRPCVLLRNEKAENENEQIEFGGSCRNPNYSPIPNLKQFLESTGQFIYIQGHDNAAGVRILKQNIPVAISACNEKLKDIEFNKCYFVDFDLDASVLGINLIRQIYSLRYAWGQGMEEPLLMVRNIPLERTSMHIVGKTSNTWKYESDSGITYIRFTCPQNDPVLSWVNEAWDQSDCIYINAVCKLSVNQFQSVITPQVHIIDCEQVVE